LAFDFLSTNNYTLIRGLKLTDQKYFVDLALTIVFESSESRKDELISKINECIQMMLEEEQSISLSSSINSMSEEQIYSIYNSSLPPEEYN